MKALLDVMVNKSKAVFSKRIAFSTTVFGSHIAKYSALKQHVRFYNSKIGDYSYAGRNCLIQNTEIGKFVSIADGCNIGLPSHPVEYLSTSPVFLNGKNMLGKHFSELDFQPNKPTQIGNDVWIGSNALIKAGVKIGDGAIIGAGAVVTHDVPPYEIWAGVPAKCIRKRFDDETIAELLKLRWWDWDDEKIKRYAHLFSSPNALLKEANLCQDS